MPLIEFRPERNDSQWGGYLVIQRGQRRVRFALYVGQPPGSHIGFWRTRVGPLRGVNLRVGRRYVGPTVTAFIHWRWRNFH